MVSKGKGRKSCCYYMTWISRLRDNYEFENIKHAVVPGTGFLYDDELWLLNAYGWARHFKITGAHSVRFS